MAIGTLVLDFMAGLGLVDLQLKRLPAIFADFLRLGAQKELQTALQLVGYELVQLRPLRGSPTDAVFGIKRVSEAGAASSTLTVTADPPGSTVLSSIEELQAVSDAVSRLVEPRSVPDGCTDDVCPTDGARRFVKRDGTAIWVHLDPLRVATDVCGALADVFRRLMPMRSPTAETATAEESADAAAAAAVGGACSSPDASAPLAAAPLDLSFLGALRVKHTACDSGEEFMIPYELASVADGAQNVFCIPDYYNLTPAHLHYMLHSMRYSRRTHGRILCGGIVTGAHVPAHEIVHIVQHFAGQIDRSKHSGQAEHDACRLANALYVSAIRSLRAALSAAEKRHLPPYFALLGVLVSMRSSLYLRANDAVDGEAFRVRCRDEYGLSIPGPKPVAPPAAAVGTSAAAGAVAAAPAELAAAAVSPSPASTEASPVSPVGAAGGAGAVPAAAAACSSSQTTPSPAEATVSAAINPVMQIYLDWMASFGLSNPVSSLHAIGAERNEEALKTMCTADASSSCVRQGRERDNAAASRCVASAASSSAVSGGSVEPPEGKCSAAHAHAGGAEDDEGCVLRHLSDDATARLLHVCFANRSGDVHSEHNRSVLTAAVQAQCIPSVSWDSLFELLTPCCC